MLNIPNNASATDKVTRSFPVVLIWAILGVYPLLMYPLGQDPESTWLFPKIFYLLVVSVLSFYLAARLPARQPAAKPIGKLPLYLLLILALIIILSALNQLVSFGDSFTYVFLGGELRLNGLLYLSSLVLLGMIAHRVFLSRVSSDPAEKTRLVTHAFYALSTTGFIQSVISLAEFVGYSPIARLQGTNVLTGTVGNPGILGALLAISSLASLSLYLTSSTRTRLAWAALAALELFTLGIATNRASILGVTVSLLLWIIIWPAHLKNQKPKTRSPNISNTISTLRLSFIFFIAISVIFSGYLVNRISGGKDLTNTRSAMSRVEIWKLAFRALNEIPGEPFIGGGPDAFRLALATRVPIRDQLSFYIDEYSLGKKAGKGGIESIKRLWTKEDPIRSRAWMVTWSGNVRPTIFRFLLDRAHDFTLDRLLSYGLFGAIAWLALYFGSLLVLLNNLGSNTLADFAIAAMLVSIFVYGMFWFLSIQIEPIVMVLAVLAWVSFPSRSSSNGESNSDANS